MFELKYKLRNLPALVRSLFTIGGAKAGATLGAMTFLGTLSARVCHYALYVPGQGLRFNVWQNLGLLSARLVTDAGVAFLVDDWDNNATDITNFNYHDAGTGTNAENVSDTALQTPWGGARVSGTKSQPAANQIRTVGTISFTGTYAITEHGIFSASSSGTLWDRSVFSAINVGNGDSIEFTYTLTVNSGG